MSFFSRLFRTRPNPPSAKHVVAFDEEKITHVRPNGQHEVVRWENLLEINILTTGDGPFASDLFWILSGAPSSGCLIPGSADGFDSLLPQLQQLPAFDNEAVVRAMGSTSMDHFLCWRRHQEAEYSSVSVTKRSD